MKFFDNEMNGVSTNGHANGTKSTSEDEAFRPKTGIKVIVVGAGFGGLATAIECQRQGHDVSVYESFAELKPLGDIISFGSNAGRIFRRWFTGPDERISDLLDPLSMKLDHHGFNLRKWDGQLIMNQQMPPLDPTAPVFNGHRGDSHKIVFNYAKDFLKIPFYLGSKVKEYFDDEQSAGIILDSGEKVTGDVVIGADGVRSKAREVVLGYVDVPHPSGYTSYRAWFSSEEMMADPQTRKFCENGDTFQGWIGSGVHLLFSTLRGGTNCCWAITFKESDRDESFQSLSRLEKACKVVEGWDPVCQRILSKTPEDKILDWKLVYRDPLPRWVSSKGRIALVGDSAHSMLPTSAQGGTQAMEDGVTVAICLREAGRENIPVALRAFQDIRYERVKAVQKTGETTREMWHKADWSKAKKDPKSMSFPREDWIHGHDAEKHAEEVVVEAVTKSQNLISVSDAERIQPQPISV